MSIDELITKALNGAGGFLKATDLYALVGDVKTDEIYVLNLESFFTDNFRLFVKGEQSALILLGAYYQEEDARNGIAYFRENNSLSVTGLVTSPEWQVLIADIANNKLFILSLTEYYVGYTTLFQYRAEAGYGKAVINIYNNKEAAEEAAEIIRMYIKDEAGNIL